MKTLSQPTSIPEKPIFYSYEIEGADPSQNYKRNLPHLRMQDATYFVTFRLADSIPKTVLQRWYKERHDWLLAFGVDYR